MLQGQKCFNNTDAMAEHNQDYAHCPLPSLMLQAEAEAAQARRSSSHAPDKRPKSNAPPPVSPLAPSSAGACSGAAGAGAVGAAGTASGRSAGASSSSSGVGGAATGRPSMPTSGGALRAKFVMPPFSRLDASQRPWQDRKRQWQASLVGAHSSASDW